LRHEDYGKDLVLVLFQFYVNPIPEWLTKLKEIESYRKKEKAIGIPIVVNDEDFFNKTEKERRRFLEKSIFQKLDLLAEVIKRRKLDTDINRLASDLKKYLSKSHRLQVRCDVCKSWLINLSTSRSCRTR